MTPAEKLGYKVGDKFITLNGDDYNQGSVITLIYDDGTDLPQFQGLVADVHNWSTGEDGKRWLYLHEVQPYKEPKEPKEPKAKRPHHDVILKWLDGAEVQWADIQSEDWHDTVEPTWRHHLQYRVKPQPKPDVVRTYSVKLRPDGVVDFNYAAPNRLELVFDGETGVLKATKVSIPKES